MFKFSFEWLKDYCGKNIKFDDIISKLKIQGFEFQGSQKIGDDVVTAIEVKANRPDMLSHMGIAREIKAFDGQKIPHVEKSEIKINNDKFPLRINANPKCCKRFCAIELKNVDCSVKTPEYITRRLNALGINSVNSVVDIGNYIMIDMGQPVHCYDADKLSGGLHINFAEQDKEITTFSGETAKIKAGDIIISDDNDIKCVAGVIGSDSAAVTEKSKNIILEAAVFDEVSVRLTSRRLKISTPSSFRFERGVNSETSFDILSKFAQMVTNICGGTIEDSGFDYYPSGHVEQHLKFSIKDNNKLLGVELSGTQIMNYLEKYDFKCRAESDDIIDVTIPSYRLDVKIPVDIAEEIARIHGYDNIVPVMPTIQTSYRKNTVWSNMDIVREALRGLGFSETINYSFIPADSMKIFDIEPGHRLYSDLALQNPIAGAYALMRPMMTYSLLNCLAYNYSVGNSNLALFEIGRVYFKDKESDTGCKEIDTCAFIMSGTRTPRGFGSDKDIKYTYYDLLGYLNIIMNRFGCEFKLESDDYKFCEEGSGYSIIINGKKIGFIGELNRSKLNKIPNVKLIRDKIFYCEFYLSEITEKVKKIKFISKYPPVRRLYNLVQKKNIPAAEVIKIIKDSGDVVQKVTVNDIYSDKSFAENLHAVLYEVNYCSKVATLTAEEIENIEKTFLSKLSSKYGIEFKK